MKKTSIIILLALALMTIAAGCKKLPDFTGNSGDGSNFTSSGFSINETQKVQFATGNLEYQASTRSYRFAENQFEILGPANMMISPSNEGWIDLFGWGTGKEPTNSSQNNDDYNHYIDWGDNDITNGNDKEWRTLSFEEWFYLLNRRNTNSGIRYAKADVNFVYGVILLPDNWSESFYALKNTNEPDVNFNGNHISETVWNETFATHGAIFLPLTGCRLGTEYNYEQGGGYWSSTSSDDSTALGFFFNDASLSIGEDAAAERHVGYAVRLVYNM